MNSRDTAQLLVHKMKENIRVAGYIGMVQVEELQDRIYGELLIKFKEGQEAERKIHEKAD